MQSVMRNRSHVKWWLAIASVVCVAVMPAQQSAPSSQNDAAALDSRVRTLYLRREKVVLAAMWRLAGWVAGAGETFIILYGFGHPVSLADAIILESLSHAARTAAFVIPGGLGVQDGALMVLAAQLGLGGEMGLMRETLEQIGFSCQTRVHHFDGHQAVHA